MYVTTATRYVKRSVIAYLVWRTMSGLSDNIELSFMRVGHTRCSVDGYFGLLKQRYRSSNVDTMDDVSSVIESSCEANSSVPFTWQWRMWDEFFAEFFRPIEGIRKYQHFRMSSAEPGIVHARDGCFDAEVSLQLLKAGISTVPSKPPAPVAPAGISEKRLAYLENQLAPYLTQDSVAPWL